MAIKTHEQARYAGYELALFLEREDPQNLYDWREAVDNIIVALRVMQEEGRQTLRKNSKQL